MSHITAVFEVFASTFTDLELDTTDMTPDQIADVAANAPAAVSICHQCAHDIDDPQGGELTAFSVDGRTFERDAESGRWVESR